MGTEGQTDRQTDRHTLKNFVETNIVLFRTTHVVLTRAVSRIHILLFVKDNAVT